MRVNTTQLYLIRWLAQDAYGASVMFDEEPERDKIRELCPLLTGTIDVFKIKMTEDRRSHQYELPPPREKEMLATRAARRVAFMKRHDPRLQQQYRKV